MDGGAICLARDGNRWVWSYRTGPGERGDTVHVYATGFWETIDEFAKKIDRTIDYPDYVDTLPTPRRREAIMATRKLL